MRSRGIPADFDQMEIVRRLHDMGIKARVMEGGRCVLASMLLGDEPFESLGEPIVADQLVFTTVGHDKIKCLRPRALSVLPLLNILHCKSITALENQVRRAWNTYLIELRSASNWLDSLGLETTVGPDGNVIQLPIVGEGAPVMVQVREPHRVILPSQGALSGLALQQAEDRTFRVAPGIHSSVDLQIAVSARFAELQRLDARLKDESRRRAIKGAETRVRPSSNEPRNPRLLLVGPRLAEERSCIDSLRLRNYEIDIATTHDEALDLFSRKSPELVLADVALGRSEGIELIPALRGLVGIEDIPVVLVDGNPRSARRLAAQRAGAAGYLGYPLDISRIAKRLEQMVNQPRRRRFTRFEQQLSVEIPGISSHCTSILVGRGGLFIRSDTELEPDTIHECEIALHRTGESLQVEAEVLYNVPMENGSGVGTRFHHFEKSNESILIDFLASIEYETASPA